MYERFQISPRSVAEDGAAVLSKVLPRTPDSVPVARHLVRDFLADEDGTPMIDAAESVVAELVGNAVRHARGDLIRVTVREISPTGVRVAVIDKSRELPVLRTPAADALSGRGLVIVDSVARQWGVDRLPWGKRVWADLECEESRVTEVPQLATARAQTIYVLLVCVLAAVVFASAAADQS
ncbi:ATP-binding protein [Streptomyces sp. NPDC048290]|uniref:ATP-binding protein n=1 Tax=Streptomyces sp. NPDC048290 TaxID=3155811 RepID=UPI0034190A60